MDFSCGIGNHSIPLSHLGYSVVGYDPSSVFLKIAKQRSDLSSAKVNNKPDFIRGDPYNAPNILSQSNRTNFDVIIIMDNSFGYLGQLQDIFMLRSLLKVANQKCILILETENRDWRLENFEPVTFFESEQLAMLGLWKFNFETSISEGLIRFFERKLNKRGNITPSLKMRMLMRLYSLHEIKGVVEEAGWNYKQSYDDIVSLKPFSNSTMSIFSVSSVG